MKKNQSLLIIDDDPLSLTLLSEYLKNTPYHLVLSDRGNHALDLLNNAPHSFSAIILDRILPDIDTSTLLHSIKHHPSSRATPIIMLSGKAEKDDIIDAYQNGIYDFLFKPIDKKLLMLVITRALRDSLHHLVVC